MNYRVIAQINRDDCIGCGKCYVACEDTSHQSIAQLIAASGQRSYEVIDSECVGCNLCEITCPVQGCITMVPQATGKPYMNWTQDLRNPRAEIV
jgi:dihydropyrimidine dehydrogenase (NAD+) subunit PreA